MYAVLVHTILLLRFRGSKDWSERNATRFSGVSRPHCSVVDADIVDQAGEEGAWRKIAAGAEIQAAV